MTQSTPEEIREAEKTIDDMMTRMGLGRRSMILGLIAVSFVPIVLLCAAHFIRWLIR